MAVAKVANPVSFVRYKCQRFLITDAPTDKNVEAYIREFARHHVTDLVRACSCTYSTDRVIRSGVEVHEMDFPDGDPPPDRIVEQWLTLCERRFGSLTRDAPAGDDDTAPCIAVHCVAGLGRAPVLVAIALIEGGMEPMDAVQHVRASRPNAFNRRQVLYLTEEYRRRRGRRCCIA